MITAMMCTRAMETLPEISEPLKLTTINDDCKELIFECLEWRDLINVTETNFTLQFAKFSIESIAMHK